MIGVETIGKRGRGLGPARLFRRAFSFPVLLGALLVLVVLLITSLFRIDPDTWWHLVVGQGILASHTWPHVDTYSFTARGASWMEYEWLGDVILARTFQAGQLRGLMILLFAVSAAMTLLIYYYADLRCRNSKAAFVATLAVLPLVGVWFTLHPQLLGYLCLLITLICLERFRQGREWTLWLIPAVFLFWVNTHGTFTFGLVALGVYWLCGLTDLRVGSLVAKRWTRRQRIQLISVTLASIVAGCITPYGTRLLSYPAQWVFYQQEINDRMTSWQPIPLNVWHGKLFLVLVLLFFVAVLMQWPNLRLEDLALFLFAVVMTALHARVLPLFAIVFAPLLADLLKRWVDHYDEAGDRPILNVLFIAVLAVAAVKAFPTRQSLQKVVADGFPVRAVEFLRQHPQPQPMLNELVFGGYLLYGLGARYPLFIDGRVDVYQPSGVLSDYLQLPLNLPFVLRKYGIQSCLLPPKAATVAVLAASPEWQKVYSDAVSVLYVRKQPAAGRRGQ